MRHLLPSALWVLLVLAATPEAQAGENQSYTIKQGDTPAEVAKRFKVPLDELLRFNNLSPRSSFRVGDTLKIPRPGQVTGSTYVVQSGDSVAKIADFHGVSQEDLLAANGMKKGAPLKVGGEITVPMILRGGASRSHVVQRGDTLASIAAKHDLTARALANANKLKKGQRLAIGRTLVVPDKEDPTGTYKPQESSKLVKSGEKIPGGVRHTVQPGQSLWTIARAYNVKGAAIAKRNGFEPGTPLGVGQKIIVPGAKAVVPVRVEGFVAQSVHFVRVWNNESITVRLMTRSGKINQTARKQLSILSGPRKKSQRWRLLNPRLIHMIQRVAEHWPGRTIEIVSGYRPGMSGNESMHSQARALDFRVGGVSNRELYEFCTQLPKSGCGYYPNSVFIHMDARDKETTWTDLSAPGEEPVYVRRGKPKAKPRPKPGTRPAPETAPDGP